VLSILFHFRTDFPTKIAKATKTMHITINMKNSTLAIVAAAAAIPVKPKIPAIIAMKEEQSPFQHSMSPQVPGRNGSNLRIVSGDNFGDARVDIYCLDRALPPNLNSARP
jgi:hypothetical protein